MTDSWLGKTLGDFAVKERIGAGGAGEVFLAEQLTLGRQAVIKVMARGSEESVDAQERFLREARLASRLDHPFAAHVYAFGVENDGTLWIAMELVRGTPLDRLVSTQGPIALARFVPLFERLCEVLNAAHEQDIVHRDIKPANVMVLQRAGKLFPKLLDLGIARGVTPNEIDARPLDPEAFPATGVVSSATPVSSPGSTSTQSIGVITMSGSLAGRLTRSESMHLTQLGSVVGTPHYMAPEQWADASRAGAKADIYSLAILAFQCLTGRVPFDAKTLKSMARAHASTPLPMLPDSLPEEIHRVLAKGAAKNPEDRYGSPLEFAAALRAASGLGLEPPSLPQLDEGVRDNLLSEAPQPIAEAVAAMEGARTARRAVEAVAMVMKVVCRYLGVIALAARARVGPGAASDSPETTARLAKLRDEGIDDSEWLQLAQQLAAPFASREEAHPLPELVRYFVAEEGGWKSLHGLFQIRPPSKEEGEGPATQHLLQVMPKLSGVLERVSFLSDYALVVQSNEPHRWMGTRRLERIPANVGTTLTRGEAVLVDALGAVVLRLPPLLQCIAPSGGAPEEMFLLDGPGRHGAKLVALPGPFERQDESLWQWMVSQSMMSAPSGSESAREKVPYKGLSTFSTDDADNYFGREKEAEAFANRLRKESFLAVVGPSGTGKSSFILAGVLPLLPNDWKPLVMRPGATPSLPREIAEGWGNSNLVLVVDQFEELVTLCQDIGLRTSFAAKLMELSRHPSGKVRVVVTLRDDFLIKVQQIPVFRDTLSNSLQLLGTPAPEDLRRVVTEPARRIGYTFDDADLPRRMVEAVSEYSGALALLSFTASQLWELRDRHLRMMRVKTYDALGGVGGALANHAEATLATLSEEERRLVREAFRHLVTAQGTRAVLTKKEALEVLGGADLARGVLEKLVSARLLVSSETADGNDSIEVIHEALITAWPRLVTWQREDAESARLRDTLRASARQWEERGRPSGLLWRKETLAEYRVWRMRFPGRLTQLEEAFAAASLQDEARGVLIRRSLAIAAFIALVVGLIVIFRAYRVADANAHLASERAHEAQMRLADLRVEQARLAALDAKPFETLLYVTEAKALGANSRTLDYVDERARTKIAGVESSAFLGEASSLTSDERHGYVLALSGSGVVTAFKNPSLGVVYRHQPKTVTERPIFQAFLRAPEAVVCTASGAVVALDARGAEVEIAKLANPLMSCALADDHQSLLGLEDGGKLHIWKVEDGPTRLSSERVVQLLPELAEIFLAPDGTAAIAVHGTKQSVPDKASVQVVDVKRGAVRSTIPVLSERVTTCTFDASSKTAVLGARDSLGRIIDVDRGTVTKLIRGHSSWVSGVAFVDNDQHIATASADKTTRIWTRDGELLSTLSHDAPVTRVRETEEGVVTTTETGQVTIWEGGLATPGATLFGHVTAAEGFVALGDRRYATSASDGFLRIWNMAQASTRRLLKTPTLITFQVPDVSHNQIVSGPDDGNFHRFDLASGTLRDSVHLEGCVAMGHFVATRDENPRVFVIEERALCSFQWGAQPKVARMEGHTLDARRLALSKDEQRLASSSDDGTVIVWDTASLNKVSVLQLGGPVKGVDFSSDRKLVAASTDDGTVHLFDAETQREIRSWHAHGAPIYTTKFTPRDEFVLTSSNDHDVALWRLDGTLHRRFTGHSQPVYGVDVSADGALLASVDWQGQILVWDIARGWAVDRILLGGSAQDVTWVTATKLTSALGQHSAVAVLPVLDGPVSSSECRNPLELVDGQIRGRATWPEVCRNGSLSSEGSPLRQ